MGGIETLEILTPGPLTTVQDLGRYGFGRYGVPPSGAVDSFSMRAANLLVGNAEGDALLEITLMGFKAKAIRDLTVAITGGDLQPHLNREPLGMWRCQTLKAGDVLALGRPRTGFRAYLALAGGIGVEPVLGSRSTNLASKFGGHEGRALRKGDRLFSAFTPPAVPVTGLSLPDDSIPRYGGSPVLRVLPGPHDQDFPQEARRLFVEAPFTMSLHSDRAGIRLSGTPLRQREGLPESIISEGVVPGAIQVPGDGQPIIILVETVTGGYRKIGSVISADLPLLGQLKPGDRVRFQTVSMEDAMEALRRVEGILRSLRSSLQHQTTCR
jgi:antagonist of KipI